MTAVPTLLVSRLGVPWMACLRSRVVGEQILAHRHCRQLGSAEMSPMVSVSLVRENSTEWLPEKQKQGFVRATAAALVNHSLSHCHVNSRPALR